jgi:putative pyoverdin transport system ATP-binding/permease protein
MKLFTLFTQQAPNRVFIAVLLSALAGLGNALLIPILLTGLSFHPEGLQTLSDGRGSFLGFEVAHYKFAAAFLVVCLLILVTRTTSRVLLKRVILEAATQLRVDTYRRIMRTPVADLERLGSSKLLAALTLDVSRVAAGARNAPDLVVAGITLAGALLYLFFLNTHVFRFVLGATLFGLLTHQIPALIGRHYLERARAKFDGLHERIRGLIYGTKELRLNRKKRERYFQDLLLVEEHEVLRHEIRAHGAMTFAQAYGELLGFFLIGATAYIFVSYHAISNAELIAVVVVLLYITGPINAILATIPSITRANLALRNLERVFAKLTEEEVQGEVRPLGEWQSVRLSNVSYRYETAHGGFDVGPVSLELAKGEVTFIVGGNGSGKSTLCKLIAFHYVPDHGEIYIGNVKVDRLTRESCRQVISAVFTDYFLFDRLLVELSAEDELLVQRYLGELGLRGILSIQNGRYSRTTLSDGQRKRLALLSALLEDREIYVFDEWAENQDPLFKQTFYLKILPELKARGKLVVIVSHDDRYFNLADKVVVMEAGKIVRIERIAAPANGSVTWKAFH